jgi:ATP-dependent DNA ligase
MPSLRRRPDAPVPADPADWRPQLFARTGRNVTNPIVEPMWHGVRVIARVESGSVRFVDEDGIDCTDEFAPIARALLAAAQADSLILDGYLTVEPTQASVGVSLRDPQTLKGTQMVAQMFVGSRIYNPAAKGPTLDPERPIAFVAVDLLSIDGESMLDFPLLERKRILDGALGETEVVRKTPFVRPPVGTFLTTWRSLGFTETAWKGANSRYSPGGRNEDWAIAPMPVK